MKKGRGIGVVLAVAMGSAGLGCAHPFSRAATPLLLAPAPTALVQLAHHNGFRAGHADGEQAAADHAAYAPRFSRTYADTPGYEDQMGPFMDYQEAFRVAYLRGYERGFYHEQGFDPLS